MLGIVLYHSSNENGS